jgi:hypothetical protein
MTKKTEFPDDNNVNYKETINDIIIKEETKQEISKSESFDPPESSITDPLELSKNDKITQSPLITPTPINKPPPIINKPPPLNHKVVQALSNDPKRLLHFQTENEQLKACLKDWYF